MRGTARANVRQHLDSWLYLAQASISLCSTTINVAKIAILHNECYRYPIASLASQPHAKNASLTHSQFLTLTTWNLRSASPVQGYNRTS